MSGGISRAPQADRRAARARARNSRHRSEATNRTRIPSRWAERAQRPDVLDPWQRDVLLADDPRLAILCCRQSGKSTIVGLKAADLVRRGGLAVVVAPIAAPVVPAVPQAQPASRRRRREAPARDADRTRDRPRRPRALPARRPARHAARAVAALADDLAPDRRRGGAGARDDVGDDLADAGGGTARPSGAPVDAGRCYAASSIGS